MKKSKSQLFQTGITKDGIPVMGGVFKFYETQGVPLDTILFAAIDQKWIPDWIDFYKSATLAGMKHDRVISKLEEGISDSFGSEIASIVISKLNSLFKGK